MQSSLYKAAHKAGKRNDLNFFREEDVNPPELKMSSLYCMCLIERFNCTFNLTKIKL